MQPLDQLLPSVFFLAGAGALALGLKAWRRSQGAGPRAGDPDPGPDRPAPGGREAETISLLSRDVTAYTIATCALPLILCAALILPVRLGGLEFDRGALGAAAALAAAAYSFSLLRLIQLVRRRRDLRMRRDAKITVGQALSALREEGFRVYHDFAADGFAIDHILVGSSGVFAVATRAVAKSGKSKRIEDATVTYNGHALFFRGRVDDLTIPLAHRQADWLSEWIGRAVGDEVAARPVVVVPGWHVQRTTPEGIPVVSPRQIPSLFKYIIPRPLDSEQILRISRHLEQASESGAGPAD